MTSLKIRVMSARDAVRLVWRCWRISRKWGIPFDDVFEMHMAVLDDIMREVAREQQRRKANLHSRP